MIWTGPAINSIEDAIAEASTRGFERLGDEGDKVLRIACGTMICDAVKELEYTSQKLADANQLQAVPDWVTPKNYFTILLMLAAIAEHLQAHQDKSALPPMELDDFRAQFDPRHHDDIRNIVSAFCSGLSAAADGFSTAAHYFRTGAFDDLIKHVCDVTPFLPAPTDETAEPHGGRREGIRLSPESALKDLEGRHARAKHPLDEDRDAEHVVPQIVYDMLDLAEEYPEDAAFIFKTVARLLDDKAADRNHRG